MKIKLLIGIPGYAPGAVLEATPAPHYAVNNPKWFVNENVTGVYAYEAEELQDCGHPVSSIVAADEGTHYCIECIIR